MFDPVVFCVESYLHSDILFDPNDRVCLKVAKCLGSCTRHQVLLSIIVAVMSVQGIKNIYEERSILGEFSAIHEEQLVGWILENTNESKKIHCLPYKFLGP